MSRKLWVFFLCFEDVHRREALKHPFRAAAPPSVAPLDVAKPRNQQHSNYWKRGDILDRDHIIEIFSDFRPQVVLHMAARTDLDERRDIRG